MPPLAKEVEEKQAIEVSWEDQRMICAFGRIHRRVLELNETIRRRGEDLEKINDALDEVIICDEVKCVFGESFFDVDADGATSFLEAQKERISKDLAAAKEEKTSLDSKVDRMKGQLYAKFGSQIYLEAE